MSSCRLMLRITFFIILTFCLFARLHARELTLLPNPGCPEDICNKTGLPPANVLYGRSVSSSDALHIVLSSGPKLGYPTLLLVHSNEPTSVLSFNWPKFISTSSKANALTLNATHDFTASITFSQLIAFNDSRDEGKLPPFGQVENNVWASFDMSGFPWENPSLSEIGNEKCISLLTNHTLNQTEGNVTLGGMLELRVCLNGEAERSTTLPRLQYTGENSMISLIQHAITSPWPATRFAYELLFTASRPMLTNDAVAIEVGKSVDDEYTPGIFQISTLRLNPLTVSEAESMFLQFKTICYTTEQFTAKESTFTTLYAAHFLENDTDARFASLEDSATFAWLGARLLEPISTTAWAMNVSFGQSEDKFYKKTNYSSWTVSFGMGEIPVDSVSVLVIMVIACGLGLPFLLIVGGSLFVVLRRFRRRSDDVSAYEPINT